MASTFKSTKEQESESKLAPKAALAIETLISNLDGKVKVEDATASKIIRETLLKIKEEIGSLGIGQRIAIPLLGVFVLRGGEGEPTRFLFHIAQDKQSLG